MPNGRYFLNDLELEQQIKDMNDRQLLEFTARQTYDVCILATSNEKRIAKLENKNLKLNGIIGGSGALIGAAVAASINFMLKR